MSQVASVRVARRDRLITAAARFAAENGWGDPTMAKLADLVGVSRQTGYTEIGGKPQLAEAMVLRELQIFLDMIVRLVLSHGRQPAVQPAQTAQTIAWIAEQVLGA